MSRRSRGVSHQTIQRVIHSLMMTSQSGIRTPETNTDAHISDTNAKRSDFGAQGTNRNLNHKSSIYQELGSNVNSI